MNVTLDRAPDKCDITRAGFLLGSRAGTAAKLSNNGGGLMTRVECKGCGVQFVALRSDAATCSPRCRKRYERMCREITRRMEAERNRRTGCEVKKTTA